MKIQDKFKSIGENGCYIIAFCKGMSIDTPTDIVNVFDNLLQKDIINKNCYIQDNNKLAAEYNYKYTYLTNIDNVRTAIYDIIIKEYFNPRTGFHHFVLFRNNVDDDSMSDSITVKEGYVLSYRCFKKRAG